MVEETTGVISAAFEGKIFKVRSARENVAPCKGIAETTRIATKSEVEKSKRWKQAKQRDHGTRKLIRALITKPLTVQGIREMKILPLWEWSLRTAPEPGPWTTGCFVINKWQSSGRWGRKDASEHGAALSSQEHRVLTYRWSYWRRARSTEKENEAGGKRKGS